MLDVLIHAAAAAHGEAGALHGGAAEHAQPEVFGLGPTFWVGLAMLLLIGIMLWKKVPAMVAAMLDSRIAAIRTQLDEAAQLRSEAEVLRGEYQAKLAALDAEATAMRDRAELEAKELVERASADATALVARRQRMAEDRISAAERAAVSEVRETATRAAVAAARKLIADGHDAAADKPLVDRAIADIARV